MKKSDDSYTLATEWPPPVLTHERKRPCPQRRSLAVQVRVVEPRPDLNHFLRCPAVHQHQTLVGARVGPVLLFNVKSPKALMLFRSKAHLPKAHASVDIVDGVKCHTLGDEIGRAHV